MELEWRAGSRIAFWSFCHKIVTFYEIVFFYLMLY